MEGSLGNERWWKWRWEEEFVPGSSQGKAGQGVGVGSHPGMPEAWGEMQMMLALPGHFLGMAQCFPSNSP